MEDKIKEKMADFLFEFFGKNLIEVYNGFQEMYSYLDRKKGSEKALNHPLVKAIKHITWKEAYAILFDEEPEEVTEELFYEKLETEDDSGDYPYAYYWEYTYVPDYPMVIQEHLETDGCCILYMLPNGHLQELPWSCRYNINIEE